MSALAVGLLCSERHSGGRAAVLLPPCHRPSVRPCLTHHRCILHCWLQVQQRVKEMQAGEEQA